ncbi:MAG: MBL fold metallo-hydrolase [Bacteroidales bacterium]|nr:MBL fold metallo-hydrolase [Bacteroidales bacterium]
MYRFVLDFIFFGLKLQKYAKLFTFAPTKKENIMLQVNSFVFNPFAENTYVIYDETRQCVIIDPGCHTPSEVDELLGFIDLHQLEPLMVVNTHGHIDHIMGNEAVKRHYGIQVAAHPEVKNDILRSRQQAMMFGLPMVEECKLPEVDLTDGELIKVGNSTLEVLCTPGHAKGSVSLYAMAEGWVFTGDALFCRSIGRTDFPGGDFEELRESIRTRLFTLPEDTEVYSGHGESTTIGEEKDFNPYVAV